MLTEMPGVYEIRFSPVGQNDRLPLLFACDDEDAKQIALLVRDNREMQIWCGCRLVASYPPQALTPTAAVSKTALPIFLSPQSFELH